MVQIVYIWHQHYSPAHKRIFWNSFLPSDLKVWRWEGASDNRLHCGSSWILHTCRPRGPPPSPSSGTGAGTWGRWCCCAGGGGGSSRTAGLIGLTGGRAWGGVWWPGGWCNSNNEWSVYWLTMWGVGSMSVVLYVPAPTLDYYYSHYPSCRPLHWRVLIPGKIPPDWIPVQQILIETQTEGKYVWHLWVGVLRDYIIHYILYYIYVRCLGVRWPVSVLWTLPGSLSLYSL